MPGLAPHSEPDRVGGSEVGVAQHIAQHTGDVVSPCIREPSVGEYPSE